MRTRKYNSIGKKGIGPIAIALVIAAGLLVFEGVVVSNFVANMEVIKRSARELGVIDAINLVEFAKKYMQNAVSYSFYKASYDVLKMGGFCISEFECPPGCKMPYYVPSRECKPFWMIYDSIYAPPYYTTDSMGGFKEYLINRTQSVFNDYSRSSIAPSYCPPDGEAKMSESDYLLTLSNVKNDAIEYTNNDIRIVEHTTNFTDGINSSPLDLFKYTRETFVVNDKIGLYFSEVDMELGEDEYCGDRVGDRGFGDVCENEGGPSLCEIWLQDNCYQYDVVSDPCDYNKDGIIDADENYRCIVEGRIEQPFSSENGNFMATVSLDDCTRSKDTTRVDCMTAGHATVPIYDEIAVDWDEYKSGGSAVFTECAMLYRCGCADQCEVGEGCQALQCEPDGSCPPQAEIDAACTDKVNNCGYYASCTETDGWCEFNWYCNENTCGEACCQRMNTLYQDLECDYQYFGTASVFVQVKDVKTLYPIDSSWTILDTSFYIASGNDGQCSNIEPIERSVYIESEDDFLCSPAIVTNIIDQGSGCKILAPTNPEIPVTNGGDNEGGDVTTLP